MTRTTPADVARKLRDAFAAMNRHDVDPYLAMMDPDFEIHDPTFPEPIKGKEVVRKINETFFEALPDLESKLLSIAVGDDVVVLELVISGTFTRPLKVPAGTVPPTGRHFDYAYAALYRFNSEGLLTSLRNYGPGLRQELGLTG